MKLTSKNTSVEKALNTLIASGLCENTAFGIARQLANEVGLTANHLRKHPAILQQLAKPGSSPKEAEPLSKGAPGKFETEQTETCFKVKGEGFATIEEVIAKAKIDLTKWKIVKVRSVSWEMGYKNAQKQAQKIPLFAFSVECAPVAQSELNFGLVRDAMIAEMNAAPAPQYRELKRTPSVGGVCLVVNVADAHFGKYASLSEVGEEYNLAIARQRVIEGVSALVGQAKKAYDISKVLLIFGNDVLHTDNTTGTTTGGTFQNTAGMWHEAFKAAKETFIEILEMLLPIADTHVVFNPSNHDYASGFMLCDSLASWFRNAPSVTFDGTMAHRKYFQWGKNLIGSTHGDGARPADLPLLMANEVPQMWAESTHRFVYTGHIHHKLKTQSQSAKDYVGVTVEAVRSPSATDSWHSKKGYIGVPKACEIFVHGWETGQIARFTHTFSK